MKKLRRKLGMKPKVFQGSPIRFAVGESSLGRVLAATSEKGICAILIGDNGEDLVEDLRKRFPQARLVFGGTEFQRVTHRVVELVEAPATTFEFPLDVRGTIFQRRVWMALREVPAGSTTTYADVAKRIGRPKAVRAVGSAIAANPIAVAIPCHRVIRSNGEISGYHWGVQRKRKLLSREARRSSLR